jgi:hypothetical protein
MIALAAVGTSRADDLAELRAELSALRAEQVRLAELQKKNESVLLTLESRIAASVKPTASATTLPALPSANPSAFPSWSIAGDLRVRNQLDTSDDRAPDRDRSQIRARFGATYRLNDWLRASARLVTGDADDPKTSDAQIQTWNNDLQVNLDLAYLQMDLGQTSIYAGKFPQIFARTDLVWDGDVTLSGLGAAYKKTLVSGASLRTSAALFLVDEQAFGPDSRMAGFQIGYDSPASDQVRFDLSAGYYQYQIGSIANADKVDFRTNLRRSDGMYASDYHLGDLIVGTTWPRPESRWPIRVVADYARNFGAKTDRNAAYGIDMILGRASKAGDLRLTYGYSQAEVDAVLAAFSHDNIGIGTNYRLHALTIDYTPTARTQLTGIWYRYRPKDSAFAGTLLPNDWLNRFRLYFQLVF